MPARPTTDGDIPTQAGTISIAANTWLVGAIWMEWPQNAVQSGPSNCSWKHSR